MSDDCGGAIWHDAHDKEDMQTVRENVSDDCGGAIWHDAHDKEDMQTVIETSSGNESDVDVQGI